MVSFLFFYLQDMECGKGACENGGKIYQQPGACLCECPVPYTGMKCTEVNVLDDLRQNLRLIEFRW